MAWGQGKTYLNAILWHTHAHSHTTLRTETFHTRTHLVGHGPALALLWRTNANTHADADAHPNSDSNVNGVWHDGHCGPWNDLRQLLRRLR